MNTPDSHRDNGTRCQGRASTTDCRAVTPALEPEVTDNVTNPPPTARSHLLLPGQVARTARVDFTPGSTLVAYTDGLVEHDRDLDHGVQLLSDRVLAARGGTAREISNAVASKIPINARDDIAYTVIRRVGT